MNKRTEYDKTSRFYEELITTFSADYNYYDTLLQVFQPSSILEIGCGCGRLFKVYCNRCIDVVGVDLSEELVNLAQKTYENTKVIIADITDFNLNREFDLVVVSNSLLKHIEKEADRIKVIRNIKEHLSENGIISLDHSDYLYYEPHTSDWVTADQSIALNWFPNENNVLSKVQWRKRVFDNHDHILWRSITNKGYTPEIEYTAYKYSIVQLQKHLLSNGLYYEILLTDYGKEGLNNEGKRFIAIAGMNKKQLSIIKSKFVELFSLK